MMNRVRNHLGYHNFVFFFFRCLNIKLGSIKRMQPIDSLKKKKRAHLESGIMILKEGPWLFLEYVG